jgi:TPR repeat protein
VHYFYSKYNLSTLLFISLVIILSTFINHPLLAATEQTSTNNDDYILGEEANQQGDRNTAFSYFYTAANHNDPRAYGKLASMYLYGLGTKKNYHLAYIWFHMGYLSGERAAERFRDAASSMMNRKEYLQAVESAEIQRIKQKLAKTPPQNKPPIH